MGQAEERLTWSLQEFIQKSCFGRGASAVRGCHGVRSMPSGVWISWFWLSVLSNPSLWPGFRDAVILQVSFPALSTSIGRVKSAFNRIEQHASVKLFCMEAPLQKLRLLVLPILSLMMTTVVVVVVVVAMVLMTARLRQHWSLSEGCLVSVGKLVLGERLLTGSPHRKPPIGKLRPRTPP